MSEKSEWEKWRDWEKWCEGARNHSEQGPFREPPLITSVGHLEMAARGAAALFARVAKCIAEKEGWGAFQEKKYARPIWFRGEPHTYGRLCPAIYRQDIYPGGAGGNRGPEQGVRSPEKSLLNRFRMEAASRRTRHPPYEDETAWITLAQHYRLPTRLIDWTESILTAAWFAVDDSPEDRWREDLAALWQKVPCPEIVACSEQRARFEANEKVIDSPAVIWALSPALLNYHFVKDGPIFILEGLHAKVLVSAAFEGMTVKETLKRRYSEHSKQKELEELKKFFSSERRCPEEEEPKAAGDDEIREDVVLAVKASQVDERMMLQQACFTIHASSSSLSEEPCARYVEKDVPCLAGRKLPEFLLQFKIPREQEEEDQKKRPREELKEELKRVGVRRSMLFPDLETLAREMSEEWRGWVSEWRRAHGNPPL